MKHLIIIAVCGLATGGLSGCGGTQAPTAENRGERKASAVDRQKDVLPGTYTCNFEVGDTPVDGASCSIDGAGNAMKLTMAGGDHKLSGALSPTEAGFKLIGQYTCAGESECNEDVETEFFEQAAGTYHGVVALEKGTLLNVTLRKNP